MKKKTLRSSGVAIAPVASPDWVEIETKEATTKKITSNPIEVRVGSCVVSVFPGFDKPLFVEVCKALLSL